MKNKIITSFLIFSFIGGVVLISQSFRVNQIPNGSTNTCLNCHNSEFGGDARNNFGKLVESRFLSTPGSTGNVLWGPLLASLDADNDGVTNGQELQDPYGIWTSGSPNPGSFSLVTLPGNSSSNPLSTLTINFSGMTPHVGQTLYLRVIDKLNRKEVGRRSTTISENFALDLDVIIQGSSYIIDFFADHNGNGLYDIPPTDHAWRMELDDAQGNDVLEFSHNTDFTDIEWSYLLTVNFIDMNPHIGQLFELRVEDDLTSEEIGRTRIEFIPSAAFTIDIPGILPNREYNLEFYADHNQNGVYDSPPTDHTYEMKIESGNGDTQIDIPHNTNFTDIGWKYLYTLNLLSMTPHLGQVLELRVYRSDNNEEVGRTKVSSIAGENISVSIPQIEIDHDYVVDFYADHNGNGMYDAPPTDHAWRLTLNSSTGNFVQNFSHNTNFTDIDWPTSTSVDDENITNSFVLSQNYPNPFNPSTKINFTIPSNVKELARLGRGETSNVKLIVYDVLGRQIKTLVNNNLASGVYEVEFNAEGLSSGIYFYKLTAGQFSETKKMILTK